MARKTTSGWVSPLGGNAREAAARRRSSDPKYAELEKKHEVALAVADLVILHRTRVGLTQEKLASRMGTSVSAISRLESGFHVPSLETLRKLALALGGRMKIDIVDVDVSETQEAGSLPPILMELAPKYYWWKDEAPPTSRRIIAQIMNVGTLEDVLRAEKSFGRDLFRDVIKHAEPGWFSPRSWAFWNIRLGLADAVMKLRMDILPAPQRALWNELAFATKWNYVLYGGTALALRLGHRESVDFNFFSGQAINKQQIMQETTLLEYGQVTQDDVETLTIMLERGGGSVKVSPQPPRRLAIFPKFRYPQGSWGSAQERNRARAVVRRTRHANDVDGGLRSCRHRPDRHRARCRVHPCSALPPASR